MSADDEPQDDQAFEREQQESLGRIEHGGITVAAERRLKELSDGEGLFTSDLSVSGFALCRQLGLQPISQVMGSSIYQVGYQASNWPMMLGGAVLTELDTLSEAWNEVRDRALRRLAEEARHAGADAVLGVELRTGAHDWAAESIEYVVLGTAVRRTEVNRVGASHDGAPVLTELSVADYTQLVAAGYEPLGVVAWSSVFFVAYSFNSMLEPGRLNPVQNYELREFTQGFYSAREQVMSNLNRQAEALGASGIVGVRLAHSASRQTVGGANRQRGGLILTFHAIGTAIRETADAGPRPPEAIVDLSEQ